MYFFHILLCFLFNFIVFLSKGKKKGEGPGLNLVIRVYYNVKKVFDIKKENTGLEKS